MSMCGAVVRGPLGSWRVFVGGGGRYRVEGSGAWDGRERGGGVSGRRCDFRPVVVDPLF